MTVIIRAFSRLEFDKYHTVMLVAAEETQPDPNVEAGIEYWNNQSADYNGVLGKKLLYRQYCH